MKEEFVRLVETVKRVREKCPWDREQTHQSIRKYLLEECYETAEAIDENDKGKLKEELGDVLIQVIFHSILAEEEGAFSLDEVLKNTTEKLIRRHPHVFGGKKVSDSQAVLKQWEEIKNEEGRESVLSGVPRFLPALLRAYRVTEKAKTVGFDWSNVEEVWAKLQEELQELREAINNKKNLEEEMGDVLFALVNLSRHLRIDPEAALQKATERFINRFSYIEEKAKEKGLKLKDMTLAEMDRWWEEAKGWEDEKGNS
ncbi:nucleoside triphosphate pyrophosphohydrolase [bacterium]|nr:nucleoside triphosphate pyrophosphohydrolase [bacterium]